MRFSVRTLELAEGATRREGLSVSPIGVELGGVPHATVKWWLYRQQRASV